MEQKVQTFQRINEIVQEAITVYGQLHQNIEMFRCLEFLLNKNLKGFIEVGSANGASFHCWASVMHEGPKVSVDLNHGFGLSDGLPGADSSDNVSAAGESLYPAVKERNDNWRKHFNDIRIVEGNSMAPETIRLTRDILSGELVDWIFIDAWHERFAVMEDFKNYAQFLSPGGYIGFHDIHQSDSMREFWQEMQETYENTITLDGNTGIGIIPEESLII